MGDFRNIGTKDKKRLKCREDSLNLHGGENLSRKYDGYRLNKFDHTEQIKKQES